MGGGGGLEALGGVTFSQALQECVFVHTLTTWLGHQAPLWGSDPRAVPWRGSSLSPPQLLPLLCPHVGSQEGCAPFFPLQHQFLDLSQGT